MGTALAGDCQHQEVGWRASGDPEVQTIGQPLPWGRHLPGQIARFSQCQEQDCGTRMGWGGVKGAQQV